MFGISRATLLYYDAVGLLPVSRRSEAGYRLYTEEDRQRLALIRQLRSLGAPVGTIKSYLERKEEGATAILVSRMLAINEQISTLRDQQKAVLSMIVDEGQLKGAMRHLRLNDPLATKTGITARNYRQVHRLFEKASPDTHREFLRHLGFTPRQVAALMKKIEEKP
jgi:MerR family transcriptional regulator, thiopeptide resistance regulator